MTVALPGAVTSAAVFRPDVQGRQDARRSASYFLMDLTFKNWDVAVNIENGGISQ